MSGAPTVHAVIAGLAVAVALAACGPPPPQAPHAQAKKLDASTSDISTECGLTYQVTAFPGHHARALANLEANAMLSVRSLASVYARNPAWIYQGETVHDIVRDALSMLHACGLSHAADALEHATAPKRG